MSDDKSKQTEVQKEKMIPYAIRLQPGLLEKARERAGMIPLSRIFRALILMWLSGKISDEDVQKFDKEG